MIPCADALCYVNGRKVQILKQIGASKYLSFVNEGVRANPVEEREPSDSG